MLAELGGGNPASSIQSGYDRVVDVAIKFHVDFLNWMGLNQGKSTTLMRYAPVADIDPCNVLGDFHRKF
ncbi:hypothetical protein NBRC116589_17880 [Ruegeria sp. HU-ET01832]